MGKPELSRDMSIGVLPVSVCDARPATPGKWLAPYMADRAIVSCRYREVRATGCRPLLLRPGHCSDDLNGIRAHSGFRQLCSVRTISTAFATSNTSARVIEFSIMDSIICMAVITMRCSGDQVFLDTDELRHPLRSQDRPCHHHLHRHR